MNPDVRPRRSVLYVPGSNARAVDKARRLEVDAVIFDLEDAVAPAAKDVARAAVIDSIGAGGYGPRELIVRVNAPETPWHASDVAAVAKSGAQAMLVPKVSSQAHVKDASDRLDAAGADPGMRLWIMAETPRCVQRIESIATTDRRLAAIVMGNEDLAAALRLGADPSRRGLFASMSRCVLAARAADLDILDGVYTDLANGEGFKEICDEGKMLGFDGKTLIHPGQIGIANEVFGVTSDDVSQAKEIIAAWKSGSGDDLGVIVVDGRMIERLHVTAARRVLALHAATTTARPSNT